MSRRNKSQQMTTAIPSLVKPLTKNQAALIENIEKNLITFVAGPAGCGKTHIAVGCAIQHYYNNWVEKIIITRPVVEVAGQSLGFLPGSFEEKIHPYLIPIFEEIKQFWPEKAMFQPKLEICPFSYMRGRNLKNAFIIADEMQNATEDQLRMLVTRFCEGSKMVITGDPAQSDLIPRLRGAFLSYMERLDGIELINMTKLEKIDIVRHPLVAKIIEKLDNVENEGTKSC